MGGGGSSSSSNTTSTTNTNGTSAISGDNLGVVISGVDGDIGNISMTDHGAIKKATEITKSALDSNAAAVKEAVDLGKEALSSNESVSSKAMDSLRQSNADSVSAIKSVAAQSGENARAALLMAEQTASRSQTGNSGDMTKVAIAMAVALGLTMAVVAYRGAS